MDCRAAVNFCDDQLSTAMWATGMSLLHRITSLVLRTRKIKINHDQAEMCTISLK